MNEKQALQSVPPWVLHFMTHVLKRSASILIKWIDDAREANKVIDQQETISYNGQKK